MRKNYFQKLMLTSILLLGLTFTLIAQETGENPKYVCDNRANNTVDLNLDIMGRGFHSNGGQWDYVKNSVTTASAYNPATDAIQKKVSNIFVMVGKKPGVYKFVFTASNSNACIPVGEKKMATVVILETPKPVSHVLSLCPGEQQTIDLKTLISSTLPTATFTGGTPATLSGSNLTISATFEGEIKASYTVDHSGTTGTATTTCQGPADITIQVKRDGQPPKYTGGTDVSYCLAEMPATLGLDNQLSASAKSGIWTVSPAGKATIANGIATFVNPAANDVYTFTYTYPKTSCYSAGTLKFTVSVTDDLSTKFKDKTREVCKAENPTEIINMLKDGLGVSIPLSAGTWKGLTVPKASRVDVTDGLFEVADAIPGDYTYKFEVSNATTLCGLAGKSANLTLKVIDINAIQDGRMEFCVLDVDEKAKVSTNMVTLSDYVANTASATWATTDAAFTITKNKIPYSKLAEKGVGTYKFTYSNDVGSCGKAEGELYLTVTDKIELPDAIVLKYCRPDMPDPVDLTQAIGVDIPGTWTLTSTSGGTLTGNKFAETAGTKGNKTYVLTFTSTSKCSAKATTITIHVSDDKF